MKKIVVLTLLATIAQIHPNTEQRSIEESFEKFRTTERSRRKFTIATCLLKDHLECQKARQEVLCDLSTTAPSAIDVISLSYPINFESISSQIDHISVKSQEAVHHELELIKDENIQRSVSVEELYRSIRLIQKTQCIVGSRDSYSLLSPRYEPTNIYDDIKEPKTT